MENLLSNAVKFTPAGGMVTIRLKNDLLEVSDTGMGIPEHLQENLLQKFTRANRA